MLNLYFVDTCDGELFKVNTRLRDESPNDTFCWNNMQLFYRGNGYKINQAAVDYLEDNKIVLTNDETLLNHPRFWNEETKTYNILKLSKNGEWKPLSDYAESNLRKANDLTKIFWRGIFDETEND